MEGANCIRRGREERECAKPGVKVGAANSTWLIQDEERERK